MKEELYCRWIKPFTSSILVGQIWESPYVSQADSIADGGEDVLFLTGPVATFIVLITIIHMWVLLSETFKVTE